MFPFSSMFKFGVVLGKLRLVSCYCSLSCQSAPVRFGVYVYMQISDRVKLAAVRRVFTVLLIDLTSVYFQGSTNTPIRWSTVKNCLAQRDFLQIYSPPSSSLRFCWHGCCHDDPTRVLPSMAEVSPGPALRGLFSGPVLRSFLRVFTVLLIDLT